MEVCLVLLITMRRSEDEHYFMNYCRCSKLNFIAIRDVSNGNVMSDMTKPILDCLSEATDCF